MNGRYVLITGGTGTLGKATLERLADSNCKITVFSRDETKQSLLKKKYNANFILGDVAEAQDVHRAMRGQEIVLHYAAYKQVPSAQNNVFAAIKTNIIGSQNIVDAAIDFGVERVVASSTDKSCAPSSFYGVSKAAMESIFQHGNRISHGKTIFSLARYGNVIGSNASVIPLFLKQKEQGYVTLTLPEMTRFWITVDQAVDLIFMALENPAGTIVVPKASALSMSEIAEIVAPGVEQRMIGIRPGEKIHEAMVSEPESFHTQELDDRFLIFPPTDEYYSPYAPFSYSSDKAPKLDPRIILEEIEKCAY